MRKIQGWGSSSITYFYELAVFGEQILISCRYGNWNDVGISSDSAKNWALAFRDSIQRYIHSYRVVTGIDLSAEQIQSAERLSIQPAYLIQERQIIEMQQTGRRMIRRKSSLKRCWINFQQILIQN